MLKDWYEVKKYLKDTTALKIKINPKMLSLDLELLKKQ